jgi:hypothetical protein
MALQSLSSKETPILEAPKEVEQKPLLCPIEKCDDTFSFANLFEELEEEEEESLDSPFTLPSSFTPSFGSIHLPASSTQISSIPSACLQVWDKLCTEMVVMQTESTSSTTFTLQGDAFASSPFKGATITIVEYSTAPKVFNVSITANETANNLLQTHMASFFQLLETRNFSFAIHRVDTHLSTDRWQEGKESSQSFDQDSQENEDA